MTTPAAHLFVYGTLRSDCGSAHALLVEAGYLLLGPASVQGRLYRLPDYPALVLSSDPHERVQGELYTQPGGPEAFAMLDAYEGCSPAEPEPHEFRRCEVEVRLEPGGAHVNAWAWLYQYPIGATPRIVSGDYAVVLRTKAP